MKYLLPNEITTYYQQIPASHGICIGLYVNVGSRHESHMNNGISHLLEHLHFRRLDGLSQEDLYQYTDKMGTMLNAATYKEFTCFSMKIRPEFLASALQLLRNLIGFFDWNEKDINQEKEVVLKELAQKGYSSDIQREFDSFLWKNHSLALSIIGTEESLKSIKIDDVVLFKKSFYTASNIALVFVGNIDDKEVQWVNQTLSSIIFSSDQISTVSTILPKMHIRKPDIHFVPVPSSTLDVSIAFDVPHDCSDDTITLLNCIVGGGSSSWMQTSFSKTGELESDIFSDITTYVDATYFSINYSVNKQRLYDSLHKITQILDKAKNCITPEDLALSKPFYTGNLWFYLDDIETLNFYIGWNQHIRKKSMTTLEEKIASFSEITESDLMRVAQSVFRKENITIMVSGSTSKITKRSINLIIENL